MKANFLLMKECQQCQAKRKENAEKEKTFLRSLSTVFQPQPNTKEHEDFMKEATTFDTLPNCLVFHIMRTKHTKDALSQSILLKDETQVAPNLVRTFNFALVLLPKNTGNLHHA